MTFYITALLRGHRAGSKCYEEIVKAALTGTLLGCILFIPVSVTDRWKCLHQTAAETPSQTSWWCFFLNLFGWSVQGICMTVGGIKHSEQRFNSRSAGVSSALLFISIGGKRGSVSHYKLLWCVFMFHAYKLDSCPGVFAPTLFSKIFGSLVCENCSNVLGNASAPFVCNDCHYSTVGGFFFLQFNEPFYDVYRIAGVVFCLVITCMIWISKRFQQSQTDPHLILSNIE